MDELWNWRDLVAQGYPPDYIMDNCTITVYDSLHRGINKFTAYYTFPAEVSLSVTNNFEKEFQELVDNTLPDQEIDIQKMIKKSSIVEQTVVLINHGIRFLCNTNEFSQLPEIPYTP